MGIRAGGAPSLTAAAVAAALAASHLELPALGNTAPGAYTLVNSGIVLKNAAGVEINRIWATDPDTNNYNSANLYIGRNAGLSQPTNNVDAGYENVGIGDSALASVTTGVTNVGVGVSALTALTEGYANAGVGYSALVGVTTGVHNVGVGDFALYGITVGSRNTAVGGDAGGMLSGGVDDATEVDDSVFVGYNTFPKANSQTNQIVIGTLAVGAGSNTAVLGNASVTDVHLGSEAALANLHAKDLTLTGPSRVLATGASHTVDQVITFLQNVGLCKQS